MDSKKYRILSVDLGYSAIKVCYQDQQGVLKYEKFISAVAKFPDKILEEDGDKMFTMNGITYLVGESALKVPKSYLIEILSSEAFVETINVGYCKVFNIIGITCFDSPILASTYICCSTADFI